MPKRRRSGHLTAREIEVITLVALGCSNERIAEILCISSSTIKNFVTSIKAKTKIQSRTLLAFYALGKGYVSATRIKSAIAIEQQEAARKQRVPP